MGVLFLNTIYIYVTHEIEETSRRLKCKLDNYPQTPALANFLRTIPVEPAKPVGGSFQNIKSIVLFLFLFFTPFLRHSSFIPFFPSFLPSFRFSICLFFLSFVCLSSLPICTELPIYLSPGLSIYLLIYLSIYLSIFSIHLSIYISTYLSISLSSHLSISLYLCLSV